MRVYLLQITGIAVASVAAGYAIYWRTGTPMAGWFVGIALAYLAMRLLQHRYRKAGAGAAADKKKAKDDIHDEEAVILEIPLSDAEFGTEAERNRIQALAGACERVIARERAGEYDGDEFGGGTARLYFYGPDAEAIADLVHRCVHDAGAFDGALMIVREGGPGAPERHFPIRSSG